MKRVRRSGGRKIVKECLKEKVKDKKETKSGKEREKYLKRKSLSQAGVGKMRKEGTEVTEHIKRNSSLEH